jgi:hypothetical protein
MINNILLLISGIVVGLIFITIKNYITNKIKEKARNAFVITGEEISGSDTTAEACLEPKVKTECFSGKKLWTSLINIINPVLWAKDLASLLNLRKLIIVGVVLGAIYGYGWYQGHMGKPVIVDWRGKEEFVRINEHYLHIKADGSLDIVDKDRKTVLKRITVKDVDSLRKLLKPYGFIFEPIFVAGLGSGAQGTGFEAGIGVNYLKWFKWVADICITNRAIYPIGVSYKITQNTQVGLSLGQGYKGDQRILFKVGIKF